MITESHFLICSVVAGANTPHTRTITTEGRQRTTGRSESQTDWDLRERNAAQDTDNFLGGGSNSQSDYEIEDDW